MAKYKIINLGDTGIYLIDNFLTASECAILRKIATKQGFKHKTFYDPDKKSKYVDNSHLIFLKPDLNRTVIQINERIYDLTGFPAEQGETLNVARYQEGGIYRPHNDYYPSRGARKDRSSGRVAQILIYLNDVEEGGETHFTHLGIKIVPKRGRAVLWYGIKGMIPGKSKLPKRLLANDYAMHAPMPIKKGEKWIAAKFLHDLPQKKFNSKPK